MALVRELTKKFEEIKRGKATEILEWIRENPPRGEIVLVVEGAKEEPPVVSEADLKWAVSEEIQKGLSKKKAIQIVAGKLGVSKRLVYEAVKHLKATDS
jgi:16S rRNA (cytidine1402-2'-O)-methyltransferase